MNHQSCDAIVAVMETISQIRRPRLLLRAARIGTLDYRREAELRHVLSLPAPPPPGPATVRALLDLEEHHETLRTRHSNTPGEPWRAVQHLRVLIALLAEARLMAHCVGTPPAPPGPRLAFSTTEPG